MLKHVLDIAKTKINFKNNFQIHWICYNEIPNIPHATHASHIHQQKNLFFLFAVDGKFFHRAELKCKHKNYLKIKPNIPDLNINSGWIRVWFESFIGLNRIWTFLKKTLIGIYVPYIAGRPEKSKNAVRLTNVFILSQAYFLIFFQ